MKSKNHNAVGSEAMPASSAISKAATSAVPALLRTMHNLSVDDIMALNGNLDRVRRVLADLATMQPAGDAAPYVGYHISATGLRLISDLEVHELSSKVHQDACCLVHDRHLICGKRAQQMMFGSSAASQVLRSALIEFMALCLACDRNGGFPTIENSRQVWEASGVLQRLMYKHPSF